MKKIPLRLLMAFSLLLSLAALWSFTLYGIHRAEQQAIAEAEHRTRGIAHAFAEHGLSIIKRVDSTLIQLTSTWVERPADFESEIRRIEEAIADISIQVGVTDRNGTMIYSNLGMPTERLSLADREHVRVHFGTSENRLHISKPVLGRVSGRWSIQFSRPLFRNGQFDGVIIISVRPDLFSQFFRTLSLDSQDIATMIRDSGEIMARTPEWEKYVGQTVSGSPYFVPDAPLVGTFRRVSAMDGIERLHGYHRLPEYQLNFVAGVAIHRILEPVDSQRRTAVTISIIVSLLLFAMAWAIHRILRTRESAEALIRSLNIGLEERVAERNAELIAANRELEAFTFATSHDLKGPLGRINNFSALLERNYRDRLDGDGLLFLDYIRQNATRLNQLVEDLLAHARAAQKPLELQKVNVSAVVEAVIQEYKEDISALGVEIRVNVPPVPVLADPYALTQVLSNLVENALKYSSQASSPFIEIESQSSGGGG